MVFKSTDPVLRARIATSLKGGHDSNRMDGCRHSTQSL